MGRIFEPGKMKSLLIVVGAASIVFAGFQWQLARTPQPARLSEDSKEYLSRAYNLARDGVLSGDDPGGGKVIPDSVRPPLYPLFLAGVILLDPRVGSVDLSRGLDALPRETWRPFRLAQTILLLLTAILTALAAWVCLKSLPAAAVALLLVATDSRLVYYTGRTMTELPAALGLVAAGLACLWLFRQPKPLRAVCLGAILAGLSLTRGEYEYLIPIAAGALSVAWWRARRNPNQWVPMILLLLACSTLPVASWKARNYLLTGQWHLTVGGGVVLEIRSLYNSLPVRELSRGLLCWAQVPAELAAQPPFAWGSSPMSRERARSLGYQWLAVRYLGESACAGFSRQKGNLRSVYLQAWARQRAIAAEAGDVVAADARMRREALSRILSDPLSHLFATPLFAYRGMWIGPGYFPLFVPFLFLAAASVFWRSPETGLLLLPASYTFLFHSLATHHIGRYSIPLIPFLYLALIIVGMRLGSALLSKTARNAEALR